MIKTYKTDEPSEIAYNGLIGEGYNISSLIRNFLIEKWENTLDVKIPSKIYLIFESKKHGLDIDEIAELLNLSEELIKKILEIRDYNE